MRPRNDNTLLILDLCLVFILCCLTQAAGDIYYITPNEHTDSCTESCLTLSQFAANSSDIVYSNTTLAMVFLPGTHYLNTANLTLSNVENIAMESESFSAQIVCSYYHNIHFSLSQLIHISNLEFIGCGGFQVKSVEEFMVRDTIFRGRDNSGTALELIDITAVQIVDSTFSSNRVGSYRACIPLAYDDNIYDCFPRSRSQFIGGAIIASNTTVYVYRSNFEQNRARFGGAIYAEQNSIIYVRESEFMFNSAYFGGAILSSSSTIIINASNFHHNKGFTGPVLFSSISDVEIEASEFHTNDAFFLGGVLSSTISSITIKGSNFYNNIGQIGGGVLDSHGDFITIGDSNFTENASPLGTAIYARESSIQCQKSLLVLSNYALTTGVIYLFNSDFRGLNSANATFLNNTGSLLAFNSNIMFSGHFRFIDNKSPPQLSFADTVEEGGAITLIQSQMYVRGACYLERNFAENGGAIHSIDSTVYLQSNSNLIIAHNVVTRNGGGIYLFSSELSCQQNTSFVLDNNTAIHKGGGLHAISSTIKATSALLPCKNSNCSYYNGAQMYFTNNSALRGGGLSLEANARFYILKYDVIRYSSVYDDTDTVVFMANIADYGGAVYVDDGTNSGGCTNDSNIECFFQVLRIYLNVAPFFTKDAKTQSISFSLNHARILGSTLYGGLLDRCALSQFGEANGYYNFINGGSYRGVGLTFFKGVSVPNYIYNLTHKEVENNLSISSLPVRVYHCINNTPDCTNQGDNNNIQIKKGELFIESVVAVDQSGQPVSATIQTSLRFAESGLGEGQLARKIPAECTNLIFNVVSPHSAESLTLYASDGPCRNADLSTATIGIDFLPCSCPIGLQVAGMNSTNCTCECHTDIDQHVDHCDSRTGSLFKQAESRTWISYINDTDLTGYLVYPNCPFDYCLVISPPLDLNQPNGADAQCAFNRSSLLCGSCQPGLSLSLGSSHCLSCPSYWPALLIAITTAAILAGMALVAFLLVLNMTVAVGTLNGLIFYANVVYVNKYILLPFQGTNFITVFISWLNLELGFDTCFFPGMDTYTKTWLQLAFPIYVILLVIIVIVISSYSTKFANLIGRKDPVATLATLILLSYAKLLEICFRSLSVGILEYTGENLWLPDATVRYLSGKHIPLFIVAVLILLVGLVYTALLFSWQWLLYLPGWRIFRWLRNPKIQTFIQTYHIPCTAKHRYWTGLLLIIRVILYLVSSVNVSNDPAIALTAISYTVVCILVFRLFIGSRTYRKRLVDVLEAFFYFNLLSFAIFTWYSLDEPNSDKGAAAFTSVTATIVVTIFIILYHMYTYTQLFSNIKKTKFGGIIDKLLTDTVADTKVKRERRWSQPPDDDIHRFNELLDMIDRPVDSDDYTLKIELRKPVKPPTQSVVEVRQPKLAPPDPNGTGNNRHVPRADADEVGVNDL